MNIKSHLFSLITMIISLGASAQVTVPEEYAMKVKMAKESFDKGDYLNATIHYSEAFNSVGGKALLSDRLMQASAYTKIGNVDSAFYHLNRIALTGNFIDYDKLSTDASFYALHGDQRWNVLLDSCYNRLSRKDTSLNLALMRQLDSIFVVDQMYRISLSDSLLKNTSRSHEENPQWDLIRKNDSTNLNFITSLLNRYGWLGEDKVGIYGNMAIFLTVQHSNTEIQEKYLPLLRNAVKEKKAPAYNLAYLEDRISVMKNGKQTYGTQLFLNKESGKYELYPIVDAKNVDVRRKEIGLGTLKEYLLSMGIKD